MKWQAEAPSNIALIKYMGKHDHTRNIPTNSSLSFTLPHLYTRVELTHISANQDCWQPLPHADLHPLSLSEAGQKRFLQHLQLLKNHYHFQGYFMLRSANNFPHNAGLASSASSFAALTRCATDAICAIQKVVPPTTTTLAKLSQQGSGSSCRSFFSPWALWTEMTIEAIQLPYPDLIHQVIITDSTAKTVTSSMAHQQIISSPLFNGRTQRAQQRLHDLSYALQQQQWDCAYRICWDEFNDMHQLFATAHRPFYYRTTKTEQILKHIQLFWAQYHDGPIVTMDAGPNIHLLWRADQAAIADQSKQDQLFGNFNVI